MYSSHSQSYKANLDSAVWNFFSEAVIELIQADIP